VLNESEVKASPDYICLCVLSKRVTSDRDKLTIEFCERVNKSRTIDKFMEFNFMYFFDASKVFKNRKPADEMVPFEFFLDLTFPHQHLRLNQSARRLQVLHPVCPG